MTAVLKAACCPDSALQKRKEKGDGTSLQHIWARWRKRKERDEQGRQPEREAVTYLETSQATRRAAIRYTAMP